jgi:hypothetical protein
VSSLNSAFRARELSATTVEIAKGLDGRYGDEEVNALFSGRRSSMLCSFRAVAGKSSMELAWLGVQDPARDAARLES